VRGRRLRHLIPSPKPLFDAGLRWVSRIVWAKWLLSFLFWESTGDVRWMPWHTFSETIWDEERFHPGTRRYVTAFALALAAHIRYRTTLRSAWDWAVLNVDEFDRWMDGRGGRT
jgi:hypothetical protein